MKNSVKAAIMAAVLLAAAMAIGLFFRQQATVQPPIVPAQAAATQIDPGQAGPVQADPVQGSTAGGVATPEFVTEPVSEAEQPAAKESVGEQATDSHQHDGLIEKPSPKIINAIRDIKKPTPNEGQVIENPDGSAKAELGNRFRSVPVATVGKDGKVHVDYHGEKYLEQQSSEEKKEVSQP